MRVKKHTVKFEARIWIYPGAAAWHFVHVPRDESQELSAAYGPRKKGWGSIPVDASIGATKWKSSVFPDKQSGTYLLPLKLAVRRAEGVGDGDPVRVVLSIDTLRA